MKPGISFCKTTYLISVISVDVEITMSLDYEFINDFFLQVQLKNYPIVKHVFRGCSRSVRKNG